MGVATFGSAVLSKRVFQLLLEDAFATRFGYSGPRHTLFIRDLAFLPHVIQTDLPWRRIRLELVRSFLDIDCRRWGHCLVAPHSLDRSSARLVEIGNALLTPTPGGHWSGGVAVLVPPGYVLKESQDLVQGRAVAALIADRTSQY